MSSIWSGGLTVALSLAASLKFLLGQVFTSAVRLDSGYVITMKFSCASPRRKELLRDTYVDRQGITVPFFVKNSSGRLVATMTRSPLNDRNQSSTRQRHIATILEHGVKVLVGPSCCEFDFETLLETLGTHIGNPHPSGPS